MRSVFVLPVGEFPPAVPLVVVDRLFFQDIRGQRPYFFVDSSTCGLKGHVEDEGRSNQLWLMLIEKRE